MDCIKCGVKLSEGQTLCPICHTRVYHPDLPVKDRPTYPKKEFQSEELTPEHFIGERSYGIFPCR